MVDLNIFYYAITLHYITLHYINRIGLSHDSDNPLQGQPLSTLNLMKTPDLASPGKTRVHSKHGTVLKAFLQDDSIDINNFNMITANDWQTVCFIHPRDPSSGQ